jgi:hypothetical protein
MPLPLIASIRQPLKKGLVFLGTNTRLHVNLTLWIIIAYMHTNNAITSSMERRILALEKNASISSKREETN